MGVVEDFAFGGRRPEQRRLFVGVDCGQARDPFSLGVLERTVSYGDRSRVDFAHEEIVHFDVRHVQRFPLGTPYPVLVDRSCDVLEALVTRFPGVPVELDIDATGVGRAVVDQFRFHKFFRVQVAAPISERTRRRTLVEIVPITSTAGEAVGLRPGGGRTVPKKDLISAAVVLFQAGVLRIAERLPERDALLRELANFRQFVSAGGHASFGNDGREAKHDDLVTFLTLVCWAAQRDRAPGGYVRGVLALPMQYG